MHVNTDYVWLALGWMAFIAIIIVVVVVALVVLVRGRQTTPRSADHRTLPTENDPAE
jgi:heme/copper-type cytochrome/quinol oxidase subunit 2